MLAWQASSDRYFRWAVPYWMADDSRIREPRVLDNRSVLDNHSADPSTMLPSLTTPGRRIWRTGSRCAGSLASRPSCRTSARLSTGPCGLSGSCCSASGPRARSRRRRTRCASSPLLAETAGSEVLDGLTQRRSRPDASTYVGVGQGQGAGRPGRRDRRGHGDLRRRADPGPAAQAGGRGQGQGGRQDRADPGHLRPARAQQGGQGPGRARPDAVHAAAPARLGRVAVQAGRRPGRGRRRHRYPRSGRDQDRD